MKHWLAGVSVAVIAGFAASAVADDDHRNHNGSKRVFRAELVGLNEVPSVSTAARGQFYAVVNAAGTAFTYWLSYANLEADAAQAHIHFGQHHTNGGISVWLCQGSVRVPPTLPENVRSDTPECAVRRTTQPISATISADDVVGPPGQGIGLTEFAELLAAMRAGAAYANVHSGVPGDPQADPPRLTVGFPPGEIRGQIH
jgi:hypothetical protein